MNRAEHRWESLEVGMLLAVSGGFMDAYSYMCRGHVFANAQTGNILLMGINISQGTWSTAFRYFMPILFFAIGIALADIVRLRFHHIGIVHWRQFGLVGEIAALTAVALIPHNLDLLANSLTSLACGIQVESFRKIHGNGIATTMCIGNLRSATQNICEHIVNKTPKALGRGMLYYGIIACFIVGAIIGNGLVKLLGIRAIAGSAGILAITFLILIYDDFKQNKIKKLKN